MSTTPKKSHWFQFLLPLILCLLFIAGLIAYRQHRIHIEQTVIRFSLIEPESHSPGEVIVLLDGHSLASGQKVSLGNHALSINDQRCEPFQTNLFVWYGGVDLGQIRLKRAAGELKIHSTPAAQVVTVVGPDFRKVFQAVTNSSLTVPTDRYEITASYNHGWVETKTVDVSPVSANACIFAPAFGSLHVKANRPGTTYEVWDKRDNRILAGTLPVSESEIPVGLCRVVAAFHNHVLESKIAIKKEETAEVPFEFVFGAARIETVPTGASVLDGHGKLLGTTPLELTEQLPQTLQLSAELSGYQKIIFPLVIKPEATNVVQTNLVSLAYINGMRDARLYLSASNYQQADKALQVALKAVPHDQAASNLQRQIVGLWSIKSAKDAAKTGDYKGACMFLKDALNSLPDNEEAKQLLGDYQVFVPAQLKREHLAARLQHPREVFDDYVARYDGKSLFQLKTFSTSRPFKQVAEALNAGLSNAPAWTVSRYAYSERYPDEVFCIEAQQKYFGGLRKAVVVGGQIKDDETQLLALVMEYESSHTIVMEGFKIKDIVTYSPMRPTTTDPKDLRNERIQDGIQRMQEKIQQAIGQE